MRHFPLTADYPAILPLGMALAAVQRDWHRLDEASNAVTRSPQEMTTAGLLEDQEAALQDLIAALGGAMQLYGPGGWEPRPSLFFAPSDSTTPVFPWHLGPSPII